MELWLSSEFSGFNSWVLAPGSSFKGLWVFWVFSGGVFGVFGAFRASGF